MLYKRSETYIYTYTYTHAVHGESQVCKDWPHVIDGEKLLTFMIVCVATTAATAADATKSGTAADETVTADSGTFLASLDSDAVEIILAGTHFLIAAFPVCL